MRPKGRMVRPMDYRTQLLTLCREYCRATGRSEARVATIVHSQGRFFDRIRDGQGCSVDTYLKVKRWFVENWPEGVAWPVEVDGADVPPRLADNPIIETGSAAQAADAA